VILRHCLVTGALLRGTICHGQQKTDIEPARRPSTGIACDPLAHALTGMHAQPGVACGTYEPTVLSTRRLQSQIEHRGRAVGVRDREGAKE
jgi:hypothetical protein